jgi:hypothetical protein
MLVGKSAMKNEDWWCPIGVWARPFSWQIPLSATGLTEESAVNNEFWNGFMYQKPTMLWIYETLIIRLVLIQPSMHYCLHE